MKVAILGHTLNAAVFAALMAECGHYVYWCKLLNKARTEHSYIQDEAVNQLLNRQEQKGFLKYCSFDEIGLDVDVYFFSFLPTEEEQNIDILSALKLRPIIHPKLMINTSTFGLHGTQRLAESLPDDDWVPIGVC